MTTDELISYYVGLLILQYASLGNAVQTMQALMGELIQDQIISQVNNSFDLANALGVQLNMLGTYRGVSRQVFGVAPGDYWSVVPYADPDPDLYFGLALYADADPTWRTLEYNDLDALAYALTDDQMRRLIQFKAALSTSDQTLGSLDDILYQFFGTNVNLVDNEDMSITYQHQHTDPDSLFNVAVLADALPHPAGVSFTVVEV